MSLIGYFSYFFMVILADLLGILAGVNISKLYFGLALLVLAASAVGKWFADRSGIGRRDSRKAEQMDNSVTKPACFEHKFIYLDYSHKTLFFTELPYLVCIVANLVLQWLRLL